MTNSRMSNAVIRAALVGCAAFNVGVAFAGDKLTLEDLRLLQRATRAVLPAEPVSLLLEVKVSGDGSDVGEQLNGTALAARVCRMLSQQVEVDDVVFRNRLSSGFCNDAARLEPVWREGGVASAATPDAADETRTVQCAVSLCVKLANDGDELEFVFSTPGTHVARFGQPHVEPVTVVIEVAELTVGEARAFKAFDDEGTMVVLEEPGDCSHYEPDTVERLAELLQDDIGRYKPLVCKLVGFGRACEIDRTRREGLRSVRERKGRIDVWAFEREFDEKRIDLEQYFGDAAGGAPIASRIDALARWKLAEIALLRARYADSEEQFEKHVQRFVEGAKEVSESGWAPRSLTQRAARRERSVARAREEYRARE